MTISLVYLGSGGFDAAENACSKLARTAPGKSDTAM
jgi:hypothetical protein